MRTRLALRAALSVTASTLALAGGAAWAQAPASEGAAVSEIVITGSRIVRNGNDAPTPTTIVSTEQLVTTTPSNIPDALNKLPAFNSASTPNNATTGANGRGFNTPGNYLNLRNLGAIRTLILQDGHRVPGTFYDTTVDTDMLPQLLVERVEVVTGGASAVYGSDAVSGVVNFILDKKFNGFKGVVQGGISKYGDAESVRVGVAHGLDVGSRGHFEWSAEYYNRNAVKDQSDRPYGDLGTSIIGSGTAANPYELIYNARQSNTAPGGLVASGPFAGQRFQPDGSLVPFNAGTPTRTANIAVGGDGGTQTEGYLIPSRRTGQAFARFDYEVSDTVRAYAEARYARAESFTSNQQYTNSPTAYPLFIYSGNAFLTPAQQAQLTAANVTSFSLNRFDQDLAKDLALDSQVDAGAITAGLQGELFGDFSWDAYYTHGETRTRLTTLNNVNSMNYFAAADAVRDPATGQVVCRVSIAAPGAFPGCAPLNLFGENRASQAAKDFIYEDTEWVARNRLDDWGANITGTVFEGPAGPIKAAVAASTAART
jgi:iron complex outermembrane receptor protein